jgi:uncharacterized membrane protein
MELFWINLMRIAHIFSGVLWVGAAVVYMFYISPSVRATAPGSRQFLQHLITRQKYPLFMNVVSAVTILAGAVLYWIDSGGNIASWVKTGPGLGFTIGSVTAFVVYLLGFFLIRPRGERMGALGTQFAAAGGPPSAAQLAEMQKIDQELHTLEWIDFVLLTIALLTMATARYWLY